MIGPVFPSLHPAVWADAAPSGPLLLGIGVVLVLLWLILVVLGVLLVRAVMRRLKRK